MTGVRAGQVDKKDYKAELDFTPTSDLDISGGFYLGNDHFGQDPLVTGTPNCAFASGAGNICGKYVANKIQIAAIPAGSGNSGNTRDVQSAHLKINYDLGFADVTYLGGYNHVVQRTYEDFTGLRYGLTFNLFPGPGTYNAYELFGNDDDSEDNSHEIRVTSKQDQSFRWAFGGDYFQSRLRATTLIGVDAGGVPAGQSLCGPANFFFGCFWDTANGSPSPNQTEAFIHEKTYSGFVSAEYDVASNVTVGAEYRQTADDQTMDIRFNSFFGAGFPEPFGPIKPAGFAYGNYRAYARYQLNDDVMFYASVADGTKNGGFNTTGSYTTNQSYGPEKNTTYEAGVKSNLLDDALQINADIFHIDSTGVQLYFPQGNGINTIIQNVGGTTNDGFEVSAIDKPLPGLTLSAAFAYADPVFTKGTFDVDDAAVCSLIPSCAVRLTTVTTGLGPTSVVNLKGLQEAGSSKENLHLAIDYTHPLGDDIAGFFHIDYRYSSKQYTLITQADTSYVSGSNNLNLRVGAEWSNYTLALDVTNLTNDQTPNFVDAATELNNFGSAPGGKEFLGSLPSPRIVSGELDVHF